MAPIECFRRAGFLLLMIGSVLIGAVVGVGQEAGGKRDRGAGSDRARHWAFIPPQKAALPSVSNPGWLRSGMDAFILHRLDAEGLAPAPEASKEILIRRVTLALTGLMPTPDEIDAFLADASDSAYDTVVNRLLGSDRFGEHMASGWLDAARYSDTNGYNNDTPRYNWRYRDWVINAFNRNLPFDQFMTEQLAGDLLPGATLDQQIATGFNRNHNVTSEGGIIDEEYRLEYVADRVDTTSTVFMALTVSCARCHDHKFDPITQAEYYEFFAFFNQVPETGYHHEHVGNPHPVVPAPTMSQKREVKRLEAELSAIAASIAEREKLAMEALPEWESRVRVATVSEPKLPSTNGLVAHYPFETGGGEGEHAVSWSEGKVGRGLELDGTGYLDFGDSVKFERDKAFSYGAWVKPEANQPMNILSRMQSSNAERGFDLTFENGPVSVHLIHQWPGNGLKVQTSSDLLLNRWTHVFATYDGSSKASGVRIYFDGVEQVLEIVKDALSDSVVADVGFRIGSRTGSIPFVGGIDEVRIYSRALAAEEIEVLAGAEVLRDLLAIDPDVRTETQQLRVRKEYLKAEEPEHGRLVALLANRTKALTAYRESLPTAMVMREMEPPRETFLLTRGAYDKPGDKVSPAVPGVFPPLRGDAPRNRLGLAQWLSDPRHPLTARVAVNRLWYGLFGVGIVETLEDFGSQGARPSHHKLLDWLANEFVESGWDQKRLLGTIVRSATYRQHAGASPELLQHDPANRLYARGPRYRLAAEVIRDSMLSASGLLQSRIGGPSVKPYQPAGLWTEVIVADDSYSGGEYVQDTGSNLYRRSVYTWWKRTCPPPTLNAFDAPDREFCAVQRARTNTPLQALVLMNDPTFIEASRALAMSTLLCQGDDRLRVGDVFRRLTGRTPTEREANLLMRSLQTEWERFQGDPAGARGLIAVGESTVPDGTDVSRLAAWTFVCSLIMNLDETITLH